MNIEYSVNYDVIPKRSTDCCSLSHEYGPNSHFTLKCSKKISNDLQKILEQNGYRLNFDYCVDSFTKRKYTLKSIHCLNFLHMESLVSKFLTR